MNTKKIVALLLAVCCVASLFAGCSQNGEQAAKLDPYNRAPAAVYDAMSQAIYDHVLGDFYDAYQIAKAETNVSRRYALMAIAEAKMLSAGIFLPTTSQGGNFAMTKIAPYTNTPVLWGNDTYRFHDRVVVNEPIEAAHIAEMKAKWNEVVGTGTYEEWVKGYLTEKGYTIKNELNVYFDTDPQSWDVLATSNAADSEILVQGYDGLYEYDMENTLTPALAESYTVSEDGKVYTFKIRQGINWVDYQGNVVAEVQADDFVAGMQHMMDAEGGLEYLVEGLIVNASEYIDDEITFDQVGVKAIDKYTLQYTLEAPASYFMTMLGYGVFAPMSRSYYESKGGKFGADFDGAAETYLYGKGFDSIAYCGPYRITSFTSLNSIVCETNEAYWNAGDNNITKITYKYTDGSDEEKIYNDLFANVVDGIGLTDARVKMAKEKGTFEKYCYVSDTDATSYCGFFNINRSIFANHNDENVGVSTKTQADRERANAAMLNKNFRLALAMSIDRGAYNAQSVGEDLKYTSLINSYTPGNFQLLAEDVTVEINGVEKTYAKGTFYGQIMQDQLDADGIPLTVWKDGASSGFDGWYNPDACIEFLGKAICDLKLQGIEISEKNPIVIDLPYRSDSASNTNQKNSMKQSIEESSAGLIKVNLVEYTNREDYLNATYWYTTGQDANFDLNDGSGWGPDYGDPQTYLDTMLPAGAGYMTKSLGIF